MNTGQDLVDRSSDPAFLLDGEGRIVAWNTGAERLLGYTAQEAVGEPCWLVLDGVSPSGEPICTPACAAVGCLHRGIPFAARELLVRRQTGERVRVSVSSLLLPQAGSQDGSSSVALVFLHSLTPSAEPAQADALRLYCLGPLRVQAGARPVDWRTWRRKQSVTLLAFLAHHRGRPVHRELLSDLLWPEAPLGEALERLKVVVFSLRRELGEVGHAVLREGPCYVLDPSRLWLDVVAFEAFLDRGLAQAVRNGADGARPSLEAAFALYRGPYLEQERYAEWAQWERARLTERYLDLLRTLGRLHTQEGHYREAAHVYRLALGQDPPREDLHRLLAQCLSGLGERAEALRQIQACEEMLRAQLGVALSEETAALRRALLTTP